QQEALDGKGVAVNVLALAGLVEGFPLGPGDTPVATDLVAQLEGTVQAVVGAALALELEFAHGVEELAGEDAALDTQAVEFAVGGAGHGVISVSCLPARAGRRSFVALGATQNSCASGIST